jgi:hypothetical protein
LSVTKLRPGLQTMTLPPMIFTSNPSQADLKVRLYVRLKVRLYVR